MPDVLVDLDFKSVSKILNLPTPTDGGDAANKAYVDSVASGLDLKGSVRVSTTVAGGNINLSSAPSAIDGVTLASGDRVLVKNQTNGVENGIYDFNGASSAMTRSSDFDTGSEAAGAFCFVEEGTTHADQGWVCTNDGGSDIVGTDALTFTQFSGAGTYTFRDGLSETGGTVDVNPGNGLQISGGAGTGGALTLKLDATAHSGNGPGLAVGANGLTAVTDGTTTNVNASNQIVALFKRYSALIGDGVANQFTLNHALNTLAVLVQIYDENGEQVIVDIDVQDVNNVVVTYKAGLKPGGAPNQHRVVIVA